MSGLLEKGEGMYNPLWKFAFTNITEEDFTSKWNGDPIVVKAGQTVTLPHHLADKMTDELVNKIMTTAIKANEVKYYKDNPNTAPNFYRAPSSLGVPAARKVWEDQIVRRLAVNEESPEMQVMRAEMREQLEADMAKTKSNKPPVAPKGVEEFAEIKAKK